MAGPERFREPFAGSIADATYLPEQPAEDTAPGVTVDTHGQALVWAMTASGHAAEALSAMATLENMAAREATGQEAIRHDDKVEQRRLADYHSTAHAIADKAACMWALVAS